MFHLLAGKVYLWNPDLVEVRYTAMRYNNKHCTSMMQVYHMSNIIFSIYLWQGIAVGLSVECLKLMICTLLQCTIDSQRRKCQPNTKTIYTRVVVNSSTVPEV